MTDVLATAFHPRNVTVISPGPVGTVGDVLVQTRLKHSNPDLPLRWYDWNSGDNAVFLGSNVQDGYTASYVSDGRQARVEEFGGRRMLTRTGVRVTDLNTATNMMEPKVGTLGDYDWRNKQATVYESNRTGFKFLPLPFGYELPPGEVPRAGGLVGSNYYGNTWANPIFGRNPMTNPAGRDKGVQAGGEPETEVAAPATKACQTPSVGNSLYRQVK